MLFWGFFCVSCILVLLHCVVVLSLATEETIRTQPSAFSQLPFQTTSLPIFKRGTIYLVLPRRKN